jgi:hypothetical protein
LASALKWRVTLPTIGFFGDSECRADVMFGALNGLEH